MRHYVLNEEKEYFAMFCRRHVVSLPMLEEAIASLETEPRFKKPDVLDRLSRVLLKLNDAEAKYRIASRLGLMQLVGDLLSSSALPYLKDTAWSKKADQD